MSTVKSKNLQIGTDGTASNNFTIYQPGTPDGTLRVGNGNAGAATDVVTVSSSGDVSVTNDLSVSGAITGTGGIYLGGTASANLLDYYEEGTWTPTITFGGNSVGLTYTNQVGKYVRIGNTVTVQCYVHINVKGSSTGLARVAGLPFASSSSAASYQGCAVPHWAVINTMSFVAVYFNPATTALIISGGAPPTSTNTGLDHTYLNNGTYMLFALTYIID